MKIQGNIKKMITQLQSPVSYSLPVGAELLPISDQLGNTIRLEHTGKINCIACGRLTKKSFSQGYCFPCMRSLAECDMCIVRPEQCHFDKGTCRDEQWGLSHCMQDHIVYLANSSGLKVGITRHTQVPTRWIDQGASQALPIYRVSSRYISGLVETVIKQHMSDRTDWRKMLKAEAEPIDLEEKRQIIVNECSEDLDQIMQNHAKENIAALSDQPVTNIKYPVNTYPDKVKALNFDKTPTLEGCLVGIKGQYLILDTGVLNIRKFTGYDLAVNY